ncbi:conjugal transfer protein TraG N-terminal domain-containing protein [Pseudoalteromonas sp. CST5]|uniref:conjugal transfer protein TraG N-terminal domain-containing protein n=1 Tax=unclassified Pseudoalteromonas TaxID=194690 RepID=UPI0023582D2E|nr:MULTISPECIES: conjugal transfer protein TraG N-terminal domain-containing protein [unclassified Pseudoalteromonas]MDC9514473.1 conjugal transfer protein TraG N-terminal domain-containing protein [Pseudoalteromonas sp. CST1]MDC9538919.1 conjugal transfer protein TraG N-terminal domain-containing protein [Pseudoalteromonas sp. CST3]MDC9543054.1 conjugal transfer protein TraG N-terminal domain-containing protein [Pseudoalteromonas sp. CST2]MDC9545872.1 conjugal transfer protein TraG N-terminal 
MVVDSTIDAYGISLAFYIYDVLWDIFAQTGLVYFPMIALIFGAVKSASESSMEDFNTKSSLRTVAMGLFFMLLALELALYPMVRLKFDDIKYYSRQCTSDTTGAGTITTEILGEEAEFVAENMEVQLGGREIRIPVLFAVALRISQGIKNWAVEDLPCSTDIRLISDGMLSQRITDEALRNETKEFIKTCYNPARRKYLSEWDLGLPDDHNWPGGHKLVMDYYDNADGDGFYSKKARPGFGNSVNELPESEQLPSDYGFPTCKEWWLGEGVINTTRAYIAEEALSTRLYNSLSDYLKDNHMEIYDTLVTRLNRVKQYNYGYAQKDVVVKESLFTPIKLAELNSLSTTDYGTQGDDGFTDWAFRAMGTIGVAGKSIEQFSGASMLQLSMPMVKPFIIMVIVISYLPAMIMSGFKWKYIGLFHGVVMSMMFWPFFWELSRLIDDTMMTALGVDFDEVNTQMLSQWIASALYLYAPLLFSTALGWVGMAGADSAFQKMAGGAGSAGQKGGSAATNKAKGMGKSMASKGMSGIKGKMGK